MVPNRHSAKNKNKHKCSSGSFKKLWQWHVDDDSIAYPKFTKIIPSEKFLCECILYFY